MNPTIKQDDNQFSTRFNKASLMKINENLLNTEVVDCIELYTLENPVQKDDDYNWATNITGLCVSKSYGRIAVSCRLGQLLLFTLNEATEPNLTLELRILTNCDRYVGMGLVTVEKRIWCITARNTGILNCWECKTGELMGSLFLNDRCHCLAVSPVLPLVVAGMNTGTVIFIDCTSPTSPRIVKVIRLYRKPLTHISFDPDGEFLITAVDDGPSILISALPTKSFEPIGHVSFTGKMHNLSVIRSKDSQKVFILLAVSKETNKTAEAVYHYEFSSDIGSNPEKYYLDDCRRLKEDVIKLLKVDFDSPKVGVCFWLSSDRDGSNHPLLIAADFQNHTLELFNVTEAKQQHLSSMNSVSSHNILNESQNIKFTRVPGTNLLLAYSLDGSVQIISINSTVSLQYSMNIHESNSDGIVAAEFCEDLNNLITCGSDGLLTKVKISENIHTQFKVQTYLTLRSPPLEQLTALKEIADYKVIKRQTTSNTNDSVNGNTSPQMILRSNTLMSLPEHSILRDDMSENESQILPIYTNNIDASASTWIELRQMDVEASGDLIYQDTKMHILNQLDEIRKTISVMVTENDSLPEIQRIGRLEFELDFEEQNVILDETKETVKQLREEISLADLAKQFIWQAIKTQCWDEMSVKGRSLKAFNLPIKVSNYPLKQLTDNEKKLLNTVTARLKIIKAVEEERETLSVHLFRNTMKKTNLEQKEEVDEEEEQEQSINRILSGSTAKEYGGSIEQGYNQMEIYTRMQKIYQIVLIKNAVYHMKECFNKEFNEIYAKKSDQLAQIQTKLTRIRKIHADLQQPHLLKNLIDPKFDEDEEPEQLFTITDAEITVEKYLSPEQLAEIEVKRSAEEERRRREKLDNWRERGLEEMMDGVLEIKKEDELKKDIPKPAFLLTGKPLTHWTEDDKRMYAEYERKVKELNEEREKYRKFLEGDLKKICSQIDEIKTKFDEQLTSLFNKWLHVQTAILQEELKIWRLKWMLLTEEELITREYELKESIEELQKQEIQVTENLEAAKLISEQVQEEYETFCADDKLMEKNLRKEFSDVHGPLYDFIIKAYKKRPKYTVLVQSGKQFDRIKQDTQYSTQYNPYAEKIWQSSRSTKQTGALEESLEELDNDPSREQQLGCDNVVWSRLCAARRRKIYKEMEIKMAAQKLNDVSAFIRKREIDLQSVNKLLETRKQQLTSLIEDYHRDQTDLELQLLIKQGFVEVNINQLTLLHDYNDALLVQREQVEELNQQIITLGESKVSHMIKNKEFKKRFYHLEWELREMLMHYEDLQSKLCDIRRFKITSEIQKYLHSNDYDALISAQITNTERTIQVLRENHEKAMAQKLARLRRYNIQQSEKLKKDNEQARKDIEEFNIILHETKFIHEQSNGKNDDFSNPQLRHKLLLQHQNILRKIKDQAKELKMLRSELALLRQQKVNVF
ncbi:unnamed protein product [Heterobilharzia americana]|nr:unnamed protein product [Heterobilharzia americana]